MMIRFHGVGEPIDSRVASLGITSLLNLSPPGSRHIAPHPTPASTVAGSANIDNAISTLRKRPNHRLAPCDAIPYLPGQKHAWRYETHLAGAVLLWAFLPRQRGCSSSTRKLSISAAEVPREFTRFCASSITRTP